MEVKWHRKCVLQRRNGTNMIMVAMRTEDSTNPQALPFDIVYDPSRLVSGINDQGVTCNLVNDVTVRLPSSSNYLFSEDCRTYVTCIAGKVL
jgi:hypothetical protein